MYVRSGGIGCFFFLFIYWFISKYVNITQTIFTNNQITWPWADHRKEASERRENARAPMAGYRENIFLAAPSRFLFLLLPQALAVVLNADALNAGRSRLWLAILAGAAVSIGGICVSDAGYWCGQMVRAEIKKVWQEWGSASPFLILRLVRGELNIMALLIQPWDDAR